MSGARGLALDPGYAHMGVCLAVSTRAGPVVEYVTTSNTSPADGDAHARLGMLAERLLVWSRMGGLQWIAYEDQAGGTIGGFQSAASRRVHEVVGLVRMLSHTLTIPLYVMAPSTAKLIAAGSGKATKREVKAAVRARLGIDAKRFSEHAADACAVWLAGARLHQYEGRPPPMPRKPKKKPRRKPGR